MVGIKAGRDVNAMLQKALMILQHRGQESAGISVFDGSAINTVKDGGLVQSAIPRDKLEHLTGNVGIGHVRYATTGGKSAKNAQPMTMVTAYGMIAIAHNGDLTNYETKKKELMSQGAVFQTDSDTELVINILSRYLGTVNDHIRALRKTLMEIDGAYALVIMINDRLYAVRDPHGIRPLIIGRLPEGYIVASESAALDALGATIVRDVAPGEIVEIFSDDIHSVPSETKCQCAHCMFEWVYFARPDSVIDGACVYDVRKEIGRILAKEHPADADLVMPIPDSGRAHAIGFSQVSGLPYEEGFMKNRFAERTFILPDQRERELAVRSKMNPISSTVAGKRIVIVDDSIVRGTTLRQLVLMLREAGAKEVHVRVGSPPIIAPCYYGVDMKTRDQFIATGHTVDEICKLLSADSLGYISMEGLISAVGKKESELCLACLNGRYPTKIEGESERFQTRLDDHARTAE